MAEYYPLLAKAVGSLPNSTLDKRRVVYERARKALIGQLRMLHPPVPDDDIERESVELDRAIERLESELASGGGQLPAARPSSPPPKTAASTTPAFPLKPASSLRPSTPSKSPGTPSMPVRPAPRPASVIPDAVASSASTRPPGPIRTKLPNSKPPTDVENGTTSAAIPAKRSDVQRAADASSVARPSVEDNRLPDSRTPEVLPAAEYDATLAEEGATRPRIDGQRPIAPQAPPGEGSRRRVWIVPTGVALIVIVVAIAAYALRDTRQTVARNQPTEQPAKTDSGKIAERVGSPVTSKSETGATPTQGFARGSGQTAAVPTSAQPPVNPEVPVAQRAALLIEAPNEPNKVKTFLGTVIWKLSNVNDGPGDSVGLAVEADIDLPDDKMKAVVTFEKNTDASLPASHTIKVRFALQPGSLSGDIQQISVPQLRQEDSPSGEALAGVTVPVVQNSFLVGLSPGNAESVNIKQLRDLQWIDVPMLLSNGKIAKLTFEKGASGDRDLGEAITAWQKS